MLKPSASICFRELVDSAELLTATKSTGHLVFNPRCLCGDKPFACLYRAEDMILFQPRDIVYRIVQALRKSCINSTSIYPEHSAPPEFFKLCIGISIEKATIGVRRRRCAEASYDLGMDSMMDRGEESDPPGKLP
jgi:hypothetical protein